MSDAQCSIHRRDAVESCTRCGTFMCDWCVRLTPEWADGLCKACLQRAAPTKDAVRLSFASVAAIALAGVSILVTLVRLVMALVNEPYFVTVGPRVAWLLGAIGALFGVIRANRRSSGEQR